MQIVPTTKDAYRLFHNGTLAFARAERQGFRFHIKKAQKHQIKLTNKIQLLENKIKQSIFYKDWERFTKGPVNIYSSDQLSKYLYDVLKIEPPKRTKTNRGSTDVQSLEKLNIKEINYLLEIRKLKKIRDTYLGSFFREQIDGIIHPSYNLNFVRTYRSSCLNPNFQNIPKRDEFAKMITRSCIYPRKGNQLMEIDYGQLEVRIAACYNGDQKLIDDILHGDMHSDMTLKLFLLDNFDKNIPGHNLLRAATKNGFVFPEFYGSYYKNCAINLACTWGLLPDKGNWKKGQGIEIENGVHLADHLKTKKIRNLNHFTNHIERVENIFWNERYKVYSKWKDSWWTQYQKTGYIDLKTGFRCSGLLTKNDATNWSIQGAAFHCLLWSFIELDIQLRRYKFKTKIIGQIHDSIILDVYPPELEKVSALAYDITVNQLAKHWDWITVPLEVEADLGGVNQSWLSLTPYKKF